MTMGRETDRLHEDRGDEPQRRRDDPLSIVGFAFRILNEQTPIALIAICSLAFMAWLYVTSLTAIGQTLHDHVKESRRYQRRMCISLAQLAGTAPALCDEGDDDRR